MKHADFVHLHTHTQYSLLDGGCQVPKLLKLVSDMKMPALAITDHGNMFGAIEFYLQARNFGIKPIIGCEVYVAPNSRFEKTSSGIYEASFHLTLLAKDEQGYQNLMRLVSKGYTEGFYYKPRIDKDLIEKYHKGIIALSGCLKGEIPHLVRANQSEGALNTAAWYSDVFGKGNFYLELQENKIQEQTVSNKGLLDISKQLSIPVVATNDIHYLKHEHARAHEALLCIQTQTTLDDPNRMRLQTDEFFVKTPQQMKEAFDYAPEAIKNTLAIAEKCNLELDFDKTHLPEYIPPENKDRKRFLDELCLQGLEKRYGSISPKIKKRYEHELSVINNSGYTSYFLIAWDFVRYAKEKGIPVGPGRGSAAGSVVSYSLGITDVDPLRYDLLFERFLNPERVSLPDIDIDFCYERRGEVIEYVIEKYGADKVAQIITFGTMLAKAAVRDVARVMGMPYAEADKIAKLIPNDPSITLEDALEAEPELKKLYQQDIKITELINTSMILEGLTRHASIHAAGVVIAEKPLEELIPLFKANDDQVTTGYPMTSLEKIGILKMDFLGLRTLTVISETLKIIKRTKGDDIQIDKISLEDKKTFELLGSAESAGVFQLESSGMRDLLKKIKPEKFEDIVALLALFRPGPIGSGMLDEFIKRKHGFIDIKYDHPKLENILKPTYGIIIYQEQVMRIAGTLAGFSMAEADSLRRAISKKTPEVMAEARIRFIEGAIKRGVNRRTADKLFNQIEYFGGYGFNKSHSAAYAMISYRTAYLKANYPVEFMSALLTSEQHNIDKIAQYIEEANRMGIDILPPDVNESYANFTVVEKKNEENKDVKLSIRFGLAAVKNVGRTAIDSIIEARKEFGKFSSLYEFTERADGRLCNRKVIESLIRCGAFDGFGLRRSQLASIVDNAIEVGSSLQKDRSRGQLSFFEDFKADRNYNGNLHEIPDIPEWPENQLLSFEKEMLGFYITKHPLARYEKILKCYSSSGIKDLGSLRDGEEIFIGGIIDKAKMTVTKRTGERMAILKVEDLEGYLEVLVFPSVYQQYAKHIQQDAIVFIKGKLSLREDQPKVIANEVIPLSEVQSKYTKAVLVNMKTAGMEDDILLRLKNVMLTFRGEVPVYFCFAAHDGSRLTMALGEDYKVRPNEQFAERIEEIVGKDAVVFNSGNKQ
jgi:DNA polymerase-3 subunit alpha